MHTLCACAFHSSMENAEGLTLACCRLTSVARMPEGLPQWLQLHSTTPKTVRKATPLISRCGPTLRVRVRNMNNVHTRSEYIGSTTCIDQQINGQFYEKKHTHNQILHQTQTQRSAGACVKNNTLLKCTSFRILEYSGSHLISYLLKEYPVYCDRVLKSKTISYTTPYILALY